MENSKDSKKIIWFYMILTYIIPCIGVSIFQDQLISVYKILPMNLYGFFIFMSTCFLYNINIRITLFKSANFTFILKILSFLGKRYKKVRFIYSIATFSFSISLYLLGYYFNDYRYSNTSISESNSMLLLLYISLNTLLTMDVFYVIFVAPSMEQYSMKKRIENFLISFSLFFLINGSGTAFMALFSFMFACSPKKTKQIIYRSTGDKKQKHRINFVYSIALFSAILIACTIFGSLIKGGGASYKNITFIPLDFYDIQQLCINYFYYLLERISVYYYSFIMTVNSSSDFLSHGASNVLIYPMKTFVYRLNYLLGSPWDVPRPEIGSIMHLNYRLLVDGLIHEREGSSPGLLASFSYIFLFPLNIICCVVYLRFLTKIFSGILIFHVNQRLTFLGIFLFIQYTQDFFQSPFDFLIVFDSNILSIFFMYFIYLYNINFHTKERLIEQMQEVLDGTRSPAAAHDASGIWQVGTHNV